MRDSDAQRSGVVDLDAPADEPATVWALFGGQR
jgi:hypothetical protein